MSLGIGNWETERNSLIAEMWAALAEFSHRGQIGRNDIDLGEFLAIAAENWFKGRLTIQQIRFAEQEKGT